jgi:hypothetical protein
MTTTQSVGSAEESKNLSQVIKIDEAQIKNHLGVRCKNSSRHKFLDSKEMYPHLP